MIRGVDYSDTGQSVPPMSYYHFSSISTTHASPCFHMASPMTLPRDPLLKPGSASVINVSMNSPVGTTCSSRTFASLLFKKVLRLEIS